MDGRKKKIFLLTGSTLLVLIIVIVIILLLHACGAGTDETGKPGLTILDGTEMRENERQADTGYIDIPRYGLLWASEENPYVYLGNPPENNVYFRYYIMDSGRNVIYDSEAVIIPGKALEVDAYSLLGNGEHTICIGISTYSIETEEPCNGAEQECIIMVE